MQPEEVRALIKANRPRDPSAGYPEEVRRAVAVYARDCRAQGQQWTTISATVGVSAATLQNWCKRKGSFLPVAVLDTVEEAPVAALPTAFPASGLVLHTPSGFWLSGLDLQQALALLQVLK